MVSNLNQRHRDLLERVIGFQRGSDFSRIGLQDILITHVNEMLDHITHEAEYYMVLLKNLQNYRELPKAVPCAKS